LHPSERAIVNFVMLNPSTADDVFDDATIRRCVGFAKRWGFSGIVVTNLFAYRATDPRELKSLSRINWALAVGAENDGHLKREAEGAHSVVFAWGDNADSLGRRRAEVVAMLQRFDPLCIRLTARGNPAHPVRERYTEAPQTFFRSTDSPERQ
jgi:hypothetical protein